MEWRGVLSTKEWRRVFITLTIILLEISQNDGLDLMDKCTNSTGCPLNSACSPRECDGNVCLCLDGFVPSTDRTGCYQGALLGRSCDGVSTRCSETLAWCNQGRCQCLPDHVPAADNLRCKTKPSFGLTFSLLREPCDGNTVLCERNDQQFCETSMSRCVCKAGLRPATPEELRAQPFLNQECRPLNFNLSLAPEELNCTEPDLPVPAGIGEGCVSYNNCPAYSDCLPRGCDGKVCVCIEGYYPVNHGMECKPAVHLNDTCGTENIVCYGENHTTACVNGVCTCGPGLVAASDGRCKPAPETKLEYALFGEMCGHFGDKRIVCHDEWTTCNSVMDGRCVCQYGTRSATSEEKARHWGNKTPCRLNEYELDVPSPEQCERRKALESCQNWVREEIVWRKFFKQRLTNGSGSLSAQSSDWMQKWKRHRDKLRKCSELMPPKEDDNWSEEVREFRIIN